MKYKKLLLFLMFFLPGFPAIAQTMNDLPVMVLKPFTEISTSAKEENLGETIRTIFQTAFDRSLVFQVPFAGNQADYSVSGLKQTFNPRSPRKIFLLDASCLKFKEEIQVDLRIHDVFTGELLDTSYLRVQNFAELRNSVIQLVETIEVSLFRDTLSTLKLTTTPGMCDIYLDSRYMGRTESPGGQLILDNLLPGTYRLRALAPGYTDYEETIQIRSRHMTNFSAALSLEPGILVIDSLPQGAEIMIDGKSVGATPKKFDEIQPGDYNIVLKAENYIPWEKKLQIESRQEKNLSATMVIMPGSLNLISDPEGVEVYYNSEVLGRTPFIKYNLEPSKYILEFRKTDYATETFSTVINPGKETKIEFTLRKQQGELTFLSDPAGAQIYVLGEGDTRELLGETPLAKYRMDVGNYTVLFEKEGYFLQQLMVKCRKDETEVINQQLMHVPGSIRIVTNPVQANIYINNSYKGISPVEVLELLPGTYTVEAKTAYGSTTAEVAVNPGKVTEIQLFVKKPATGFLSGIILAGISLLAYFSILGQ